MKVIFYGFAICFAVGLLFEIFHIYRINKRLKRRRNLKEEYKIKPTLFIEVQFNEVNINDYFWRKDIPLKSKKIDEVTGKAVGINSIFKLNPSDIVKIKVENE